MGEPLKQSLQLEHRPQCKEVQVYQIQYFIFLVRHIWNCCAWPNRKHRIGCSELVTSCTWWRVWDTIKSCCWKCAPNTDQKRTKYICLRRADDRSVYAVCWEYGKHVSNVSYSNTWAKTHKLGYNLLQFGSDIYRRNSLWTFDRL